MFEVGCPTSRKTTGVRHGLFFGEKIWFLLSDPQGNHDFLLAP